MFCRRLFSYASQDRKRVARVIQGMKLARPDMDIFFDVESLRSGGKLAGGRSMRRLTEGCSVSLLVPFREAVQMGGHGMEICAGTERRGRNRADSAGETRNMPAAGGTQQKTFQRKTFVYYPCRKFCGRRRTVGSL